MRPSFIGLTAASAAVALAALVGASAAQNVGAELPHGATPPPPAPATPTGPPPGPPRPPAYVPVRATDPAAVERGRALFVTRFGCAECHAPDIRGSAKGNTLLRSVALMQDANGELIATATRASPTHGRRFDGVTEAQFSDIAQFMKSFRNIGTGPVQIVQEAVYQSGDAMAGWRYFTANCSSCHAVGAGQASPAANLAGIGAGVAPSGLQARGLQQRWLNPPTTRPTTAVVTLPNGEKVEGRATKLDEFSITLTLADGASRTIARDGDTPKVELTYPLAAHAALVRTISDKDIHDVTGYLVTLK